MELRAVDVERPTYRIEANGVALDLAEHFEGVSVSDETGLGDDRVSLTLTDHNPLKPLRVPPTGAEMKVWLGYEGALTYLGMFVVSQVSVKGWPKVIEIEGAASPLTESKAGKSAIHTQKSRTWPSGTKLGDLCSKISAEHKLTLAIDSDLSKIELPTLYQVQTSDVEFLSKLLRKYDSTVKTADGKLVIHKNGTGKSVNGKDLPEVIIDASEGRVLDFEYRLSRRESEGSVTASWHSKKGGAKNHVTVGSGEPSTLIRTWFKSEEEASAAATAEHNRRLRGGKEFSLTLIGDARIFAEVPILVKGFHSDVDGRYIVKSVEHSLDSGGFRSRVNCELPNEG